MLNLILALTLLFAFVVIRIYQIQHHPFDITNNLVIDSNSDVGQYARVSFNEQQFWLEKTGILTIHVNDKEIETKTALRDGDIVQVGSTLMWFQTVPSMMNRRIIYRQPRRGMLQVTFGSNVKKSDIVMSLSPNPSKPRFMTLTFQSDKYIVTAHSEIPVKLPFRETSVEKGKDFEVPVSDNPSQELLILGSTKIVFSYQKGQKIVEIAVLEALHETEGCEQSEAISAERSEQKKSPCSIWQAQFNILRNRQQVALSKEHDLTITGDTARQSPVPPFRALASSAKEIFLRNSLKLYAAIIFVGFVSFPLTRKRKAIKYIIFWFVTFWVVLGSAILFGETQSNKVVEEDFLQNVKIAIDREILCLDNKNRIQLKDRNSEFGIRNSELLYAITNRGRDIREFIKAHNNFIRSDGRLGQDWFLIDEANRKILGLKKEAVTIKNFRSLQKKHPRGRFLDRDGKSVAKLRVIESNRQSLKIGSEVWLNLSQQGKNFRKDIISLKSSLNKKSKTLFNIGKLEVAWRNGKLLLDNKKGDQDLSWYTKIKVSAEDKIYDYPVLRKIRPKMVFSIDCNEGRGIIGNEEITINQNDNQIKLGSLIVVDSEKCFEIGAGNNFPKEREFQHHLSITKRGEVCYVQNLGTDETQFFVGGRILMPKEEYELQPYDFIRIGDLLMEYIPEGDGLLAGNREDGQRYYPVNLSQTVGYFCYPDLKGNLEKTFDGILSDGKDVVLTIDDDLQRIVIDELKLGLKKAGLQIGTVVLLDVETGDILAMASEPSYDQNRISEIFAAFRTDRIDPRNSPILNRALHKLYPPGSFFKIVIASAALQNADKMPEVQDFIQKPFSHGYLTRGVVLSSLTPSKRHTYAIHSLKDHGHKVHKNINIYEALTESCNVYFASLAIQLGYGSLNKAYYPPQNPLYTFAEEVYLFNDSIDLLPLQIESDIERKRIS
nr:hypothetical protein [bacterium]